MSHGPCGTWARLRIKVNTAPARFVQTTPPYSIEKSPTIEEPLPDAKDTATDVAVLIIGAGERSGNVEGLFHDRWVGPNLRLIIQPH